jgi:hypothetical protein
VLGWIALAVVVGAGLYVVYRLVRSWSAAGRRYGRPGTPPAGGGPGTRPSDDGSGAS